MFFPFNNCSVGTTTILKVNPSTIHSLGNGSRWKGQTGPRRQSHLVYCKEGQEFRQELWSYSVHEVLTLGYSPLESVLSQNKVYVYTGTGPLWGDLKGSRVSHPPQVTNGLVLLRLKESLTRIRNPSTRLSDPDKLLPF